MKSTVLHPLTLMMIFSAFIIALCLAICFALVSIVKKRTNKNSPKYLGSHVIISGGSKGIGKAVATKYAELGAHVTIVARNQSDLNAAKHEIEKHLKNSETQQIRTVSLDITKLSFPENSNRACTSQQRETLKQLLGDHDKCDVLVNCCGSSIPERFEDISQQQFHYMMEVNYFSAVNLTRILLPTMKTRAISSQIGLGSQSSTIVFVSSISGLVSFFGYSAYAASKFALVGLAEALQMELRPFNINITVSFPPDTDTPGFEQENKTKPHLSSKISDAGSLHKPEQVATAIVKDVQEKKFYSTVGVVNHAILMTSNFFMPSPSILRVLLESAGVGFLRLVAYFVIRSWYRMVDEAAPKEILKSEITLRCSKKHDKIANEPTFNR